MRLVEAIADRRKMTRAAPAGDRSRRAIYATLGLAGLLLVIIILSMGTGPTGFIPIRAIQIAVASLSENAAGAADAREVLIVLDIRLPRTLLGGIVGCALAVSGVVMQGLFRNPLADPTLVGVSSGATLAAVAAIVLGHKIGFAEQNAALVLPVAAFGGGLATTIVLYTIATRHGHTSVATMLLAGIALAALAMSLTGIFVLVSDDMQLRDFTFWSLGSLSGATWEKVIAAGLFTGTGFIALPWFARGLDALLLGQAEASHLGVHVQALKRMAVFAVAAAVGAAVAVAGPIGFIGIVVPHLLRLAIGPAHRWLLPASALFGGILLIGADMVARTVIAPAELPIGIVTSLIGAPFFLWLLLRQRSVVDL